MKSFYVYFREIAAFILAAFEAKFNPNLGKIDNWNKLKSVLIMESEGFPLRGIDKTKLAELLFDGRTDVPDRERVQYWLSVLKPESFAKWTRGKYALIFFAECLKHLIKEKGTKRDKKLCEDNQMKPDAILGYMAGKAAYPQSLKDFLAGRIPPCN